MTLFNYILENSDAVIFYSIFTGVAGALGYSFVSSYFNNAYTSKVDKGTQTDAWEDYSDRPSQIIQDSVTSIDTQTPKFSPVEYTDAGTQAVLESTNTITTVLPVPPINVNMVPNQDLITKLPDWARFCPDHPNYLVWLAQNQDFGITSQLLNDIPNPFA